MTTVGRLAKRFGISRSTLLYYHRIGLLCPSGHKQGAYRRYSAADASRLEQIMVLKSAGIKLSEIMALLDDNPKDDAPLLRERLKEIAAQIDGLRIQQRITARLLGMKLNGSSSQRFSKHAWTEMLVEAGFNEADMLLWHREFESHHPEKHARFLKSLGISPKEVSRIRAWCQKTAPE